MKMLVPFQTVLVASNVVDTDPEFDIEGTYGEGDVVQDPETNHRFESQVVDNTGHPLSDLAYWVDLGPTNRWKMFDDKRGTVTVNSETIDVTLSATGRATGAAVFGITAATMQAIATDALEGEVYNQTYSMVSHDNVNDIWDYFFAPILRRENFSIEDLPPYSNAEIQLILSQPSGICASPEDQRLYRHTAAPHRRWPQGLVVRECWLMSILLALLIAAAAKSKIEFVGRAQGSTNSATSLSVSLESLSDGLASSPSPGDFVVVFVNMVSATDVGLLVDGFTEDQELYANDSSDTNLCVAWKIMGSTPDTSVSVSRNASSGTGPIVVDVQVWRGVDQSTPLDVASTTATGTNNDRADPPAITPTTPGAKIIVCGAGAGDGNVEGSPLAQAGSELSNFSSFGKVNGSGVATALIATGSYDWISGAFNPAAFVGGSNSNASSWAAVTLALRPA